MMDVPYRDLRKEHKMELRLSTDALPPLTALMEAWAGKGLGDGGNAARSEMAKRWPSLATALNSLRDTVVPPTPPHKWVESKGTPLTGGRPFRFCPNCDREELLADGRTLRRGWRDAPCREMGDRYATPVPE